MSNNKFIVSSTQMRNAIHKLNVEDYCLTDEISVLCTKGKLVLVNPEKEDVVLCIETKSDFDMKLSIKQFRTLYRILGLIEDQPIVLGVDNDGYLDISQFVL
jgi:hypothetical protein